MPSAMPIYRVYARARHISYGDIITSIATDMQSLRTAIPERAPRLPAVAVVFVAFVAAAPPAAGCSNPDILVMAP